MEEKPRFRRRTVFAKNLGFGVGFGYRNNTRANWPGCYWPIRSWERIGPGAKRLWIVKTDTLLKVVK